MIAGLALAACSSGEASVTPGSQSQTRTVEHARGSGKVPVAPKRVVVLEPVQLDTAVALGVTPVGAAVASNVSGIPAYLGEAAAGIQPVGTVPEPSLEKIAALRPDLIIGTESRHSALYAQLADIAPTVFMATQEDPWQENVALVGEALNKAGEADALLAQYNARCDQIAAKYKVAGVSAQLVRPRDETVLSIYGPTSFAGSTLECVGLTIPDRDWEKSISVDISPERILEAQGDYVFVTTKDVDDKSTVPAPIRDNAASFPKVLLVDTSYWVSGVGPLGGNAVLDDIERLLKEAQS
jgi:iron complex transport system substrate-binding protein